MNFVVRADASVEIGTGHVMRCLSLADYLRERGAQVTFITKRLPGHLADLVAANGFKVELLDAEGDGFSVEKDAFQTKKVIEKLGGCDWLIVDNYCLDASCEKVLRKVAKKIFVVDDLADRPHDCDALLDQNLHKDMNMRYTGLVPSGCRLFLGPEYALLRREFVEEKRHLKPKNGQIRQVLVNFGGSDAYDMASLAIEVCREVWQGADVTVNVIAGASNPYKVKLKKLCSEYSLPAFVYHEQVSDMARLMASSDLGLGAGGSSHWERCFMGLGSLVITTASNQVEITEMVAEKGACVYVGDAEKEDRDQLKRKLALEMAGLVRSPQRLMEMSQNAIGLMSQRDGFDAMIEWLSS